MYLFITSDCSSNCIFSCDVIFLFREVDKGDGRAAEGMFSDGPGRAVMITGGTDIVGVLAVTFDVSGTPLDTAIAFDGGVLKVGGGFALIAEQYFVGKPG